MEDVGEPCARTRGGERRLTVVQELWAQLDVARRVHAVDVAEGGGQQIAPSLAGAEHLRRADEIGGRRVEPLAVSVGSADTVLFPADHPHLDLEDDPRGSSEFQQLRRSP